MVMSGDIFVIECPICRKSYLGATNSPNVFWCYKCGHLVKKEEVKRMRTIEYGSNFNGINTLCFKDISWTDADTDRCYIGPETEDWD